MPGHILIVDDHENVRRGLRSLLSSCPAWTVCGEASNGIEAIEKAKSLRPDVVLMDISMPRMDGIEAARIIQRDLPESKVIIMSQEDPGLGHRQAQEVEAAAFLAKSDLSQQLLPTVSRFLGPGNLKDGRDTEAASAATAAADWLVGGGALGQLIREHDWSQTSLGSIENWPQSLKTSVSVCLASRFPIVLYWGSELVVLYNDAYSTILGDKHPQALGQRCRDCWAEIWDTIGPMLESVVGTGEATWSDDLLLILHRHGYAEECYFSFSFSPVRVEAGAVGGIFTAVLETTGDVVGKRRLRTLRDLAAKTVGAKTRDDAYRVAGETLGENLHDIPFSVLGSIENGEFHILSTSGVPHDHPLRSALFAPGSKILDQLQRVIATDQELEIDLPELGGKLPSGGWDVPPAAALLMPIAAASQDGSPGVLLCGVNPKKKLDEGYRTFFSLVTRQIVTSIGEARAREEERKRAEALAELDRAKTAFFNNISHEFRTPLTLMLGPVEDLLADSHKGLSPAAKMQLELVNRNGTRLLRLVNTLLDFSRIEAGRMQAIYQPIDLAAFTVELASVFRSATEKAGLRLELDCPKLPEPVYVDCGMWEKIVLNLISNAFKFTFEGGITVSLAASGKNAELRVRDTGVGIPVPELPRLFDRFHRIENARSRTHEGTGIGLALVQELARLHSGSVRAESVLGEGSTFVVSVPFGKAHLPAERVGGTRTLASTALGAAPFVEEALRWLPDSRHPETTGEILPSDELMPIPCATVSPEDATRAARPHILVADDNADMRQYLIRLLAERYEVRAVPDGRAALEAAWERPPELVLTDVMMPNLDGFSLLHALRADPRTRTTPIILLSARAGEESRVEGMQHGADDYLIKPFSARELLARVQTHLEMARVRKRAEEDLRRRNEQFETLLNEAPLGVFLVDGDFRIRAVNPTAMAAFDGVSDLIGRDFAEIILGIRPTDYADEIVARFRHTLRTGEPYIAPEGATERRTRGNRGVFEWQISRIPLPEGSFGVVCYFRDITRQVRAREAIRQSEQTLRLAQKAGHSGAWEWDLTTRQLIASPELMELYGLDSETAEFDREKWRTMIYPADLSGLDEMLVRAIETRGEYHGEFRIARADGAERWIESTAQIFFDDSGKPSRIIGVSTDITDRKRIEESYRTLAETLDAEVRARTAEVVEQAEQLRGLSSSLLQAQDEERRRIARELHDSAGQLLTVLSLNLGQAALQAPQGASLFAKWIGESQKLVQQLSGEIRTMSYLLHPPLLDERGLVEAIRWYTDGVKERSGLKVALEVGPEFKRLSRELELVMFRLVQECLTNIHRHSGSASALIRMARGAGTVSLQVQDEGRGMAAEKLAEIQSQGSGVGIRGMRERVRHFGGRMQMESDETGTRITFEFPFRASAVAGREAFVRQEGV